MDKFVADEIADHGQAIGEFSDTHEVHGFILYLHSRGWSVDQMSTFSITRQHAVAVILGGGLTPTY
jgi:hypothetical protein